MSLLGKFFRGAAKSGSEVLGMKFERQLEMEMQIAKEQRVQNMKRLNAGSGYFDKITGKEQTNEAYEKGILEGNEYDTKFDVAERTVRQSNDLEYELKDANLRKDFEKAWQSVARKNDFDLNDEGLKNLWVETAMADAKVSKLIGGDVTPAQKLELFKLGREEWNALSEKDQKTYEAIELKKGGSKESAQSNFIASIMASGTSMMSSSTPGSDVVKEKKAKMKLTSALFDDPNGTYNKIANSNNQPLIKWAKAELIAFDLWNEVALDDPGSVASHKRSNIEGVAEPDYMRFGILGGKR